MRTTFVINLTRFGDLIQTQPVLSGYKRQGDRVIVICLEQFAKAAELLADVDQIFPFPGARILARLDTRWTAALETLCSFVTSGSRTDDRINVVNLTPSLGSRLLGSLYTQSGQLGFGIDDHGFGVYSSPWANFLQAASKLRGCSPFNLVDVMIRVAHLNCQGDRPRLKDPGSAIHSWSVRCLQAEAPLDCKGFVAFQLGASQDIRRWPVEYFTRLGEYLWARHRLCPVVVGAENERHLGERYAASTHAPRIDLIGRTDLAQLAGVLCQTELLVTNDTGTMHMAAGLDLPIVALFLATAQPWDTGPYRENCVCLEPDMACHPCSFSSTCKHDHGCRKIIKPDLVGKLVDGFLATGMWKMEADRGARGWKTVLDQGMMDLISLTDGHSDRVSWVRIQRWYYRHFLDDEPLRPPLRVYPLGDAARNEITNTLIQCQGLLQLFRQQAALLMRMPSEPMHKKFMLTWQRIQTNFEQSQWVGMLGLVWAYQTQDVKTDTLDELISLIDRYAHLVGSLHEYMNSAQTA